MTPRSRLCDRNELSTFDLAAYLGVPRDTILSWLRWARIPEPRRLPTRTGRAAWKRVWTRAEAEEIKARIRPDDHSALMLPLC